MTGAARHRLLPAAALLLGLLGGCAELTTAMRGGDLEPALDRYVAAQEYGKALTLVEGVGAQNPRYHYYQFRREQILADAEAYAVAQFAEAADAQVRGDWDFALATYEQALRKYPDSQLLRDGLDYLREVQATQSAELEREILITRGQYLVEAIPSQRSLSTVNPEDKAARELLDALELEGLEVGSKLAQLGTAGLAAGDLELARRVLPLAASLNPDPSVVAKYDALKAVDTAEKAKVSTDRRKAEVAEQRRQRKRQDLRRRDLYAQYSSSLQEEDLSKAREVLEKIVAIEGQGATGSVLLGQVERRIDARVLVLMEAGSSAYSQRQYEQAVKYWRQAVELDPENEEAQDKLARAERVLEKLRQLREKQRGAAVSSDVQ